MQILGWKIKGDILVDEKKSVVIAAPHTSNWDYIIGRIACYKLGVPIQYLIKKEACVFPLNMIIRSTGGIPIDRKRSQGLIGKMIELFNTYSTLHLIITPEGTRSRVAKWKTGFYYIALEAKVPILLGYLDYHRKEAGIGKILHPSGDIHADMKIIEHFYRDKGARFPSQYNPDIFSEETKRS